MNYQLNKARAITINTEPTLADQSQARETDINIIVGKFGLGAGAPGASQAPMYNDWSNFPTDLRETIETSRSLHKLRRRLPKELAEKPLEELLHLTPDELTRILTPDDPKPQNPSGDSQNPPVG